MKNGENVLVTEFESPLLFSPYRTKAACTYRRAKPKERKRLFKIKVNVGTEA